MSNITRHNFDIKKNDYEQKNQHKSGVFWLYGLSGSGKSSVSNLVLDNLFKDYQIAALDGDDVRLGINSDLGFSQADREESLRRVSYIAKILMNRGLIVVCSFITPLEKQRKLVQDTIGSDCKMIYIKSSIQTCEKRDPKGLYKKARKGEIKNFTGIDSEFQISPDPDLIIDTESDSLDLCAEKLTQFIKENSRLEDI